MRAHRRSKLLALFLGFGLPVGSIALNVVHAEEEVG